MLKSMQKELGQTSWIRLALPPLLLIFSFNVPSAHAQFPEIPSSPSLPNIPRPNFNNIPRPNFNIPQPNFNIPQPNFNNIPQPNFNNIPTIPNPEIPGVTIPGIPPNGFQTNKWDLMQEVEGTGPEKWAVAWGDDISETDVAQGVVAAGVSVVSVEPGPFLEWVTNLIQRTIDSMEASAQQNFPNYLRDQMTSLATDAIATAIRGQSANEVIRNFDTVDFKAGAISYSGRNFVGDINLSRTWGLKPYVAFRWRGSAPANPLEPQTAQPQNGPAPDQQPGQPVPQRVQIINTAPGNVSFSIHAAGQPGWDDIVLQPGEERLFAYLGNPEVRFFNINGQNVLTLTDQTVNRFVMNESGILDLTRDP